jgi:glycerol-3-phosphate dehydrogenase subunit B
VNGSVVVVGAGYAGLAAAFAARRAGRRATIVSFGAGASALGSGAVDDVPWDRAAAAARLLGAPLVARPVEQGVDAFAEALGLFALRPAGDPLARLATTAGVLRPARGHDRALLDLSALRDADVLVPRAARPGWDADALAASWSADPFARKRGLRFRAAEAALLRQHGERGIGAGDLAARHDDGARLEWLAARLREVLAREAQRGLHPAAILVGPWLGAAAPRAEALSAILGLPVGEALAGAGSAPGLRFEAARDRLLASLGVDLVRGRAKRVDVDGARVAVTVDGRADLVMADTCVLACGGVLGGGVLYTPPEHDADADLPPPARAAFALSLDAPVTLTLGGAPIEVVSSTSGPDLDEIAWPSGDRPGVLEAVGVRCRGVRAAEGITAAGDAIADRPRTVLEAVASGLRAGREA